MAKKDELVTVIGLKQEKASKQHLIVDKEYEVTSETAKLLLKNKQAKLKK